MSVNENQLDAARTQEANPSMNLRPFSYCKLTDGC